MTCLPDADVWVALLRGKKPLVAARFRAAPPADLRVCSVVAAELRYGCAPSAEPAASRAAVDALLAPYPSLPSDDAAADQFVAIRRYLEQLGQVIGACDLQIAAIALANGCTLVTHNTPEFSRVPGLPREDREVP